MIWSNQAISKLVADNAKFSPLPDQLLNKKFCIWDHDITSDKDQAFEWQQFVDGKTTLHTSWHGASDGVVGANFNGRVLLNSVEYGSSIETFNATFMENNTLSVLLGEEEFGNIKKTFPDIQNKLITFGDDTKTWFMAKLFPIVYDIDGSSYGGKLELVNIKFIVEELGSGIESAKSNIKIGTFGETMYVPVKGYDNINLMDTMGVTSKVNITPKSMEVYIPEAAATLGVDILNKSLQRYKDLTHSYVTTKVPTQKDYSIIPTQFKIFGVDNYGISNEGDITNSIKALMFTETLEQGIYDGTNSATSSSGIGSGLPGLAKDALKFISKPGSLGSKFFGDRGEASTSPAISTRQIRNDASLLKLFVEPDMSSVNEINANMQLDISEQDLFEINRSKGTAEQSQTPLLPDGFNPKQDLGAKFKNLVDKAADLLDNTGQYNQAFVNKYMDGDTVRKAYNMLGTANLANKVDTNNYNVKSAVEWLRVPNPTDSKLAMNESSFNDYMSFGSPRRNSGGTNLAPMYTPDNWETYIRSNHFRPDAYSWWNWPILYPSALVNVYNENNSSNAVSYDKVKSAPVQQTQHWTNGILVEAISENISGNPRANFTSYAIDGLDKDLFEFQSMCVTSSQFIIKVIDDNDNVEEFVFNSEGLLTGTAANWANVFRF